MGEMAERYLTHRQQPLQTATQPEVLQNMISEPNDTESHAPNESQSVAVIDAYRRELKRAK